MDFALSGNLKVERMYIMFKKSILTLSLAAVLSVSVIGIVDAYIGNLRSHKFHEDYCSSVYQMKDRNKIYFDTRDEAINAGYVPCKRCNP